MDRTNVLGICQRHIPSAEVGVIAPLKYLQELGKLNFTFKESAEVDKDDIAKSDVIICIRCTEKIEYEIIKESKRLNKFVIYFLDDDLLNVPKTANSSGYFENENVRNTLIDILKESDLLWTTNSNIADRYKTYIKKSIIINAPALLYNQYETNHFQKNSEGSLKVGFAGGIDHEYFINDLLREPVKKLLEEFGTEYVKFEFMGARPRFIDEFKLNYIPYQSNPNEYRNVIKQRNWDIGLAPLQDTEFHSCKYFNKFLEYGALGVAGVYSNVMPFTFVISNKENGILVDNTSESWYQGIKSLIVDENKRKMIMNKANKKIENEFTLEKIADEISSGIMELLQFKAPYCPISKVKYKKFGSSKLIKIVQLIRTHKLATPKYVLKRILLYRKTGY